MSFIGMVINASISGSNLRIVTLPVGYRPLQLIEFTVKDQQGEVRNIQVETNGRVNVFGTMGVPTTLSLDGIRFYTD